MLHNKTVTSVTIPISVYDDARESRILISRAAALGIRDAIITEESNREKLKESIENTKENVKTDNLNELSIENESLECKSNTNTTDNLTKDIDDCSNE